MKKIDITKMMISNDFNYTERMEVLGMEFVKVGKNYMIKNSNGKIVSPKEKLQLEKQELILNDVKSNSCQKETTKKISEINKELKDGDIKETKSVKKRHNSKK